MIVNLSDVLDVDDLHHLVKEGYVRSQVHPTLPYRILNYTEKAQFESAWNDVTMACRGLITTSDNLVLARPFRKFWSIDQSESPYVPDIPWGEPYRVFDKVDGSMGITYPIGMGQYSIATRGSFASDQAIHASRLWSDRYAGFMDGQLGLVPEYSLIFEIIYPANRIVIDYSGLDDLVLLGAVHIPTGQSVDAQTVQQWFQWPGPIVDEYPVLDPETLADFDRPGKEGYVLWFPQSDWRVKVKHSTYLQLHRMVTNANTKNVWQAWSEGNMEAIYELPDEFRVGIDAYLRQMEEKYNDLYLAARTLNEKALSYETGRNRAEFIIANAPSKSVQAAAFAMNNGKDYKPILRHALKPAQAEPLWGLTNEG